jgi:phospholipase D1/2
VSTPPSSARLLQVGRNCCAIARANRAAPLIDGDAYFAAFARACERAQRSITILAWDFNSKTRLTAEDAKFPPNLGDFLNYLARRRRRLQINILDWDYPMVFGADREFSPLYGLSWTPHRRVHLHYDDTHPVGGSHHQKIVVIDDKVAFCGGLDLTCKRWDTPAHDPADPRRTSEGKIYPPFHDLMIMVDGEAAAALANIVRRRWERATGAKLPRIRVEGDPWPEHIEPMFRDIEVGISCTAPDSGEHTEVRDIEQLYLDMIARAKQHIYIENQYFTSHKVGEALAARLREPQGPEVVLITRLLSHGWLEEITMHVLRTQLVRRLNEVDHADRFSVYYPHIEGLATGTCIDVHSKMMSVDDEFLRIGSSNLSNRSMGLDSECDLTIDAHGDEEVKTRIRGFRYELLAEHLGVSAEEVAREVQARGTMRDAVAALTRPERTLKPLDKLPEYSEALIKTAAVADMEKPVSLDLLVEQFAPDSTTDKRASGRWRKVVGAAALLLAFTLAWRYTPLADMITADSVTQWAHYFSNQWWAPLVILAAYTPATVVMFPRPLITLAAVVAFGPVLGFIYALTGIVLASLAVYAVGRALDRDRVRRIAGEKLNRLSLALKERGLLAMIAVRIVPVAPFIVSSLVAGAIRIKLWHYVLGTVIGMLPGVLAATIFGEQFEAALRGEVNYWVVGGVLAVLAGGALAVRRWLVRIAPAPA